MLSGTAGKISTGELLRRAVAAAPVANAALNARAVEEAIAREEAAEAASAAAASGVRSEAPRRPPPPPQTRTRRASSAASVSGPAPPRPAGDGSRRDGYGDGEDDVDADGDPATADPGTLPKELSTHWTGFFSEIFVFRGTVTPTLMPQIFLALFLGVLAQMLKMRLCGPDVIAPAECQTTFDITGHQVVSVSLGFLLVFRTDWAYDRYYEGKQSLGHLYGGLRNLNVLFATYLRENGFHDFDSCRDRGVVPPLLDASDVFRSASPGSGAVDACRARAWPPRRMRSTHAAHAASVGAQYTFFACDVSIVK